MSFHLFHAKMEQSCRKIETLPLSNTKAVNSQVFFSSAAECKVDSHYRILIPPELRAHAALEKEVTIVGVGNRVEVWSRDRWENTWVATASARKPVGDFCDAWYLEWIICGT